MGEDIETQESVRPNWKNLEEKLRLLENEQDKNLDKLVSILSEEDKTFLIIESFRISAGSYQAHAFVAAYIGILIGLDSEKTYQFLIKAYESLSANYQRNIIDSMPKNSYHSYPKKHSVSINETHKKQNEEDMVYFQLKILEEPIETVFASEEQKAILNYIKELTKEGRNDSKMALTHACAYLGYYKNLNWYTGLPLKTKGKMYSLGKKIVEESNGSPRQLV